MPLTEMDISQGGRLVLYKGLAGTGKTFNALTWPGPIVVGYTEKNLETVRTMAKLRGDVKVYALDSWKTYADEFVPAVAARTLTASTIILDSMDFLAKMMWDDIKGSKSGLSMQDFGVGLGRLTSTTTMLTSASAPKSGHPGYNVIVTVHLKDVMENESLVRVSPSIMGQFKDDLEDYFDYVLLCEAQSGSEIVKDAKGVATTQLTKNYFVYTIPPDRYNTCKGGNLPAKLSGTYPSLNEHWVESKQAEEANQK